MPHATETAAAVTRVVAAGGRRRRLEAFFVAAAFVLVAWFYCFTVQTSGDLREGADFDYYNPLVDGFRAGHLYLPIEPDPRLVSLPDPYDPARNSELRLPDASYYHEHFYLYFGVVPAVTLMLPYLAITRHHLPEAAAVLVFCLIGFTAASALWLAIRRKYFPDSASWVAPLGVLAIGFGAHVLALARRPEMWELPIAASFAFTMLALGGVFCALHGKRPVAAMFTAGLCLGLAVGSRPTALLASGMLLFPSWCLFRRGRDGTWLRAGVAAIAAMAIIGIGLAWYNYARFDSPFQFGQAYQLTSLKEGEVHHFQLRFLLHNLRVYFAWPVHWTADWPFIASTPFPPGPPGYYGGEELYWLAVLAPVLWFALFLIRPLKTAAESWREMMLAIVAVYLPLQVFMLVFFSAAERYMVEFLPPLMLLALCGLLRAEQMAEQRRSLRVLFRLAASLAIVVTICVGLLASFDYHGRSMKRTAPETWHRIAAVAEPPVHGLTELFHRSPR